MSLREGIEELFARPAGEFTDADRALFGEFKAALNRGEVRAAERDGAGACAKLSRSWGSWR